MSSAELAGRPYVVNFWASYCIPAHERYGDELAIVGVLSNNDPADAEGFPARYGDAGYAHVIDETGRLAIDYSVTGPPETFFVDAEGIVRAKQFGPLTDDLMAARLAKILTSASR